MNAIRKWTEGKPPEIAFLATTLASSPKNFYALLQAYRSRAILKAFEITSSPKQWLSFYFDHRQIELTIRDLFQSIGGMAKELLDYNAKTGEIQNEIKKYESREDAPPELLEAAKAHINVDLQGLLVNQVEAIVKNFEESDGEQISDDELNQPEIMFAMVVSAPCWIMYREYPATLLRKARQGSEEHLEKLLRLDPSVLADSKVFAHFQAARLKFNPSVFNQMLQNIEKPPRLNISLKKIKMTIAGLISIQTEKLGYRLERPEICSLFDAVSQVQENRDIDTDMPDSPESFKKALQRERAYWSAIY